MLTGSLRAALESSRLPRSASSSGSDSEESPRVYAQEGWGGRQLIVDGTVASLRIPGQVRTGCIWDCLAAPLLALPAPRRRRVLMLGLGGGSVARVIRALAPESTIVGVEIDQEVVEVARAELDLDSLGVEVILGDALEVLKKEDRLFDMIIEDVNSGDFQKPDWLPRPGHELAAGLLQEGGILVSNAFSDDPSSVHVARHLMCNFDSCLEIRFDGFVNSIFVAGPGSISAAGLRSEVRASPVLKDSLPKMRFMSVEW
eukprot:TRINITY_DN29822_c0_g1_i2.p1 TRINITY_DN29822_c0_g1~~TRINITY_DN29822_c0_g1_i2.p1  ORF type:complete len:258 (-),score=64.55 TRINITY_DN29822_c0_g1_i2:335-1108(-)